MLSETPSEVERLEHVHRSCSLPNLVKMRTSKTVSASPAACGATHAPPRAQGRGGGPVCGEHTREAELGGWPVGQTQPGPGGQPCYSSQQRTPSTKVCRARTSTVSPPLPTSAAGFPARVGGQGPPHAGPTGAEKPRCPPGHSAFQNTADEPTGRGGSHTDTQDFSNSRFSDSNTGDKNRTGGSAAGAHGLLAGCGHHWTRRPWKAARPLVVTVNTPFPASCPAYPQESSPRRATRAKPRGDRHARRRSHGGINPHARQHQGPSAQPRLKK